MILLHCVIVITSACHLLLNTSGEYVHAMRRNVKYATLDWNSFTSLKSISPVHRSMTIIYDHNLL